MKQNNDFPIQIMNVLKGRAKALNITQEVLAQKLQVSLPTLKRWLSGKAVTLETLKSISDILGMNLSEIAINIEQSSPTKMEYTTKQENFFCKHPECLAFFDNLLRGHTVQKIQNKFKLPTHKVESYLSQLEKLDLIDWLPNNRTRIKFQGEPVWQKDGPLAKFFRCKILDEFLGTGKKEDESFFLHDYLEDDIKRLNRKIEELIELAQHANKRSTLSPERSKPHGLFIKLQDYRWRIDNYLNCPTNVGQ